MKKTVWIGVCIAFVAGVACTVFLLFGGKQSDVPQKDTLTKEGVRSFLVMTVGQSDTVCIDACKGEYRSTDSSVATVDTNGRVKAVAQGEATVYAKTVDGEVSCRIYVSEKKIYAEQILLKSGNGFSVQTSMGKATADGYVTLTVYCMDGTDISAFSLSLMYDSSVLVYKDYSMVNDGIDYMSVNDKLYGQESGVLKMAGLSHRTNGIVIDGKTPTVQLLFYVKEDAQPGSYGIEPIMGSDDMFIRVENGNEFLCVPQLFSSYVEITE